MSVIKLTSANFENEALNCNKPVLVDFYADWCGPCRMVAPVVSEIAKEHPEYKICKVNVDEEGALAQAFNVSSIPMLAVIRNGKVDKIVIGARDKEAILALLAE